MWSSARRERVDELGHLLKEGEAETAYYELFIRRGSGEWERKREKRLQARRQSAMSTSETDRSGYSVQIE